jgi:tRNA (cmo5U34)-methyltransferase
MRDKVFNKELEKQFEFDENIASVFDDMLNRSVPFYKEVQKLIIDFINLNSKDGDRVIDLGSSTAQFLIELDSKSRKKLELFGVDNSKPMVEQARKKVKAYGAEVNLLLDDFQNIELKDFNFIVSNYTLQFIRPIQRPKLVKKIFEGLKDSGFFIFSEKIVFEDRKLDKDIIDIYYNYKREKGYSEYEIAKKREALENILIPFTVSENIQLCKDAGFSSVNTIFQWANFVTFIAKKG